MDDKILFFYFQGMSTREIVKNFKELYGAVTSLSLISKVNDNVDLVKQVLPMIVLFCLQCQLVGISIGINFMGI